MAVRPDTPEFINNLSAQLRDTFGNFLDSQGKVNLRELLPEELEVFFSI